MESDKSILSQNQPRKTIGLLIDNLRGGYQIDEFSGVADVAKENDYNLLCFDGGIPNSYFDFSIQSNIIFDLVSKENIDAIVVLAGAIGTKIGSDELKSFFDKLKKLNIPIVNIALKFDNIPSIVVDNYQGMYEAVSHLVKIHEFKNIAYYRKQIGHQEDDLRFKAFNDVLNEFNLPLSKNNVIPSDYYENPEEGVKLLFNNGKLMFEALVVTDDHIALPVMKILQAQGIRVPEDIAIIGFDDIKESRYSIPPLTTVRQPLYEQGRKAAEIAIKLINENKKVEENIQIELPSKFILRQSCKCHSFTVLDSGFAKTEAGENLEFAFKKIIQQIQSDFEFNFNKTNSFRYLEWVTEIVNEFGNALETNSPKSFLLKLEDILKEVVKNDTDISIWNDVFSNLFRYLFPYIEKNKDIVKRTKKYIKRAQLVVGKTLQITSIYKKLQLDKDNLALRELANNIFISLDINDLINLLYDKLPQFGIPCCSIALYKQNLNSSLPSQSSIPELSFQILGYDSEGYKSIGILFKTLQIVPGGIGIYKKRITTIIEALSFGKEQLGFILFEIEPREGTLYYELKDQISNAIKAIKLYEDLQTQNEESSKLNRAFIDLSNLLPKKDLKIVLEEVTKNAKQLSTSDLVCLFRYDENKKQIIPEPIFSGELKNHRTIEFNRDPENLNFDLINIVKNIPQFLFIENEEKYRLFQIQINRVWQNDFFDIDFWHREEIKSLIIIKLEYDGRFLGVMFYNYRNQIHLSNEIRSLAIAYASITTSILINAEHLSQLNKSNKEIERQKEEILSKIETMLPLIRESSFYLMTEGVYHDIRNLTLKISQFLYNIEEEVSGLSKKNRDLLKQRINDTENSIELTTNLLDIFGYGNIKKK